MQQEAKEKEEEEEKKDVGSVCPIPSLEKSPSSSQFLRVSLVGFDVPEVETIKNLLLYPFKIDYVLDAERSDLTISKLPVRTGFKRNLVLEEAGEKDQQRGVSTPFSSKSVSGSQGNGVYLLSGGIVSTCLERFEAVMNPKISMMYNLSTKLPFDYNIVPSSIRSRVLERHRSSSIDSELLHHLSVEVARRELVKAFVELGLKKEVERKRPPSIFVTHDVDTEKGFERVSALKNVEDELGIHSIWFIVSNEYPIRKEIAKQLGDSEIGSHDEKHDGRLIHIKKQEELVARLRRSRERLEEMFSFEREKKVRSFRAPLLQFSSRIISALGKAGYQNDFSLPAWEAVHPSTMSGFGIESTSEFELGGVTEHPLSLFQDHQVLKVLGLNTSSAIKFWIDQINLIRAFDGDVVLLVHPDYAFSEDLESYGKLMESISEVCGESMNIRSHFSSS